MTLFQAHKNPKAQNHWVSLLGGRVVAAGAPSRKRLSDWMDRGATDVVTLLREDEMNNIASVISAGCAQLGLTWTHLPLSGKRLEAPEDPASLRGCQTLLTSLNAGQSLVIHCAAGMHRTGVFLYVLMRFASLSPEEAMSKIEQSRALTAEELARKEHALRLRAEHFYQQLKG